MIYLEPEKKGTGRIGQTPRMAKRESGTAEKEKGDIYQRSHGINFYFTEARVDYLLTLLERAERWRLCSIGKTMLSVEHKETDAEDGTEAGNEKKTGQEI